MSVDAISARVDKVREWANRYGPELDWRIEDEDVHDSVEQALWLVPDVDALLNACRVQAEQIAALQEALRQIADLTVNIGDSVEAATRASWIAVEALALAEGGAAPAPEEEK